MGVVFSATAMTMRVRSRSVACPDLPPHPSQPTELVFPKSSFQSMWFESSLAWDIPIIGASAAKPHMDDYICDFYYRTYFFFSSACAVQLTSLRLAPTMFIMFSGCGCSGRGLFVRTGSKLLPTALSL